MIGNTKLTIYRVLSDNYEPMKRLYLLNINLKMQPLKEVFCLEGQNCGTNYQLISDIFKIMMLSRGIVSSPC